MTDAMTPAFDNGVVQLHHGSALDMASLADESVDCVVTSPPYWGLRDYGLPATIWDDGRVACLHQWGDEVVVKRGHPGDRSTLVGTQTAAISKAAGSQGSSCILCPAWRGTLGLEPTPYLYVEHLVQILREVWRVLKPWGTVWLNLGDSYAGSGGAHTVDHANPGISNSAYRNGFAGYVANEGRGRHKNHTGLKTKDLVLIPERVALALQDDGWWVRARIAWCKTAPMPESVDDRPTSAWEHIWMLTKGEDYFWDKEAVRESGEPHKGRAGTFARNGAVADHILPGQAAAEHREGRTDRVPSGRNMRNWWIVNPEAMGWEMCENCGMIYNPGQYRRLGRLVASFCDLGSREEKTKTYVTCKRCGEADSWMSHFAAFPQAVVEPCILAGTSEKGNCAECGRPWERILEQGLTAHDGGATSGYPVGTTTNRLALLRQAARERGEEYTSAKKTIGWQPTCDCGADAVPALVLDPFSGSGTTCLVAQKLGRRAVGVDPSEPYLALAQARISEIPLPMVMT